MIKLLLLSLSLALTTMIWAQDRIVTGSILSVEEGVGLPGVNVLIQGTTQGTTSDVDGNYSLNVPSDAQKITESRLMEFEAVIFLSTTEDIFDDTEQAAFEKYIQSGKGFVGIHAASDTEYQWEWYTKLVGRMFHIHPEQQTANLEIIDHNFPGLEHFPNTLLWTDEWYDFGKEKVDDLNYLVTVDENSFNPAVTWKNRDPNENGNMVDRTSKGMGAFHPISWYHEFDGGRSFYTALGHIEKVYENPWFLAHLYGGIYYAATGKGIQ